MHWSRMGVGVVTKHQPPSTPWTTHLEKREVTKPPRGDETFLAVQKPVEVTKPSSEVTKPPRK